MSFELYGEETAARINTLRPTDKAEAGLFEGTGRMVMQGFAKTGRALSLAAAPLAMAFEKSPNSTELQDSYFKKREEVFQGAVDHWTPKPNEIGAAAEVVGPLLSMIPQVFASPALAIASTQLSTAEDLVRKEVDTTKAQQVGAVQAAGLALGIWVPIFGRTLAERVLAGGVGFNVAQGAAMRAASGELLEGTPAAGDFKTLDATALTLDVLLGAAFGGLAHIHPGMRAEGEAWQKRISDMVSRLKPSEVDALVALKAGEHLNVDSMPGKPVDLVDTDAHVQRIRQAIDDLANDRPVSVEDMPAGRFEADEARAAEAEANIKAMLGDDVLSYSKTADELANTLEQMGLNVAREGSGASLSEYVSVDLADGGTLKIRVSNHELPYYYIGSRADYEVGVSDTDLRAGHVGGDWIDAAAWVAEKTETKLPLELQNIIDVRQAKTDAIAKQQEDARARAIEQRQQQVVALASFSEWLNKLPEGAILKQARKDSRRLNAFIDGKIVASFDKPYGFPKVEQTIEQATEFVKRNTTAANSRELGSQATEGAGMQERAVRADESGSPEPAQSDIAAGGKADSAGAGIASQDPLAAAAQRFAADNPDLLINLGKHADGSDVVSTAREYLEAADDIVRQANDDARLFDVAAGCLLGGGR